MCTHNTLSTWGSLRKREHKKKRPELFANAMPRLSDEEDERAKTERKRDREKAREREREKRTPGLPLRYSTGQAIQPMKFLQAWKKTLYFDEERPTTLCSSPKTSHPTSSDDDSCCGKEGLFLSHFFLPYRSEAGPQLK